MKWTLAGMAAAIGLGSVCGATRPNFLFVYTDDQRWDAMSCVQREQGEQARFPWFQTPNMDRLAAEGIRFRNAFVVNSLCAPSRATFLTGCYGHRNGIVNNHTDFPAANVTHATVLRSAGYTTGYIGKWHMGGQSGQRPGFDYSASFVGQGKYFDCPVEVNGVSQPTQGWIDDVSTDFAIEFLRQNKDKPFDLVVGFKATHGPFTPPPRAAERFPDAEIKPAVNAASPAIYRAGEPPQPAAKPHKAARAAKAAKAGGPGVNYFRCISAADDNLGRLLAELDALHLAEDTVVVFASDNGYYLGDHGLGDKRSAYEESLRIPLLLRYPRSGVKGKLIDQITLNIDLAPTLLDLAGVAVPKEMHGRSWKPLLDGKADDWRNSFFYCYFFERGFTTPTTTAVRTEGAKLVQYPGHPEWTELFDLRTDPYELTNLASDAAHRELLAQLQAEYQRQAAAIGFQIPAFADQVDAAAPAAPLPPGMALQLDFTSGKDANAAGRDGKQARRFTGKNCIEIPKSPQVNPAGPAWTVELAFKSEQPDGVLVAHGGATNGYRLALEGGKVVWHIVADGKRTRVTAGTDLAGKWTDVKAGWSDGSAWLAVHGEPPVKLPLAGAIHREPNDSLQIGADLKSPVVEDEAPRFAGLMEAVRIVR